MKYVLMLSLLVGGFALAAENPIKMRLCGYPNKTVTLCVAHSETTANSYLCQSSVLGGRHCYLAFVRGAEDRRDYAAYYEKGLQEMSIPLTVTRIEEKYIGSYRLKSGELHTFEMTPPKP